MNFPAPASLDRAMRGARLRDALARWLPSADALSTAADLATVLLAEEDLAARGIIPLTETMPVATVIAVRLARFGATRAQRQEAVEAWTLAETSVSTPLHT